MTTNKPEIACWGSFYKGVMQDFGYYEEATEAAAELDFHGHTLSIEPLIRLSDYEALQAGCDTLVEALEAIERMSYADHSLFNAVLVARAALAAHRKGGEVCHRGK